jgi:type IX secretion system PorP/SprF family membrane protein
MIKPARNTINYIWLFWGFFLSLESYGQPDPMFSMYFQNMQIFNPAYAGTWHSPGFTVLNRIQWIGINGHPYTQTFSAQAPLKDNSIGLGLNLILDKIGMERRLSANFDYSYNLRLNQRNSLRLGLKGGFTNYSNPLPFYTVSDPGDPAYFQEISSKFIPNFGIGAFFSNERSYFGISVPRIFESGVMSGENFALIDYQQLYATGGMVWQIAPDIKFKPAFITKITEKEPFQFDISANFLFREKFWLGGMYRSGDSKGIIAQWIFKENLRIGYAYDFASTELKNYQNGVHEVMISYELNYMRTRYVSPRYF